VYQLKEVISIKIIELNGKWIIEVYTKEFGYIILLDKTKELKNLEFNSKEEAFNYYIENS